MQTLVCNEHNVMSLDENGKAWFFKFSGDDITDSPGELSIPETVVAIGCGRQFGTVIDINGTVWAFGSINDEQGWINSKIPIVIPNLQNIVSISCGAGHFLCVNADRKLFICGSNRSGQLGLGIEDPNVNIPILSNFTEDIKAFACGAHYSVVVSMDGKVFASGNNTQGQLGLSTVHRTDNEERRVWTEIPNLCDIQMVGCGVCHTIVYSEYDKLYGFGDNDYNQIGPRTKPGDIQREIELQNETAIKSIVCGGFHTVILEESGKCWGFGDNADSQLTFLDIEKSSRVKTPTLYSTNYIETIGSGDQFTLIKTQNDILGFGTSPVNNLEAFIESKNTSFKFKKEYLSIIQTPTNFAGVKSARK